MGTSLTRFEELLIEALRSVPEGMVSTFGDIARAMGDVRAALAVRNACLRISEIRPEEPWWRAVSSDGTPLPGAMGRLREEGALGPLKRRKFFREIKAWPIFSIMARDQEVLAQRVILGELEDADVAAGVDVSYSQELAVATCITVNSEGEVVEEAHEVFRPQVPYVPTYLAFRELRGMFPAASRCEFDVIFVDGHGLSHPRRFGEATHLGLLLGKPSVGVAKSLLIGKLRGGKVVLDGEDVAIRRGKAYVSPGYKTDLNSALRLAEKFWKGDKQPIPLILAHRRSKRLTASLESRLRDP